VEIYTLVIAPEHQFFQRKGLPVAYLIGLEAGLIEYLDQGSWNPSSAAIRAKRARLLRNT